MTTVTISIPESLRAFVDHQLTDNGFGNVSEYFRTLLRDAQAKENDARLQTLLLEGLTSGKDIPVTKEFWSDLKTEAAQIAQKHRTRKKT